LSDGKLFVISAPAGTGKTTLANMLFKCFKGSLKQSISCTTRSPRSSEVEGRDYYFLMEDEFERRSQKGDFLEEAKVFKHRYGTLKQTIEDYLDKNLSVLLVIDTQGAMQIKDKTEGVFIFIKPPSMEVLTKRLEKRNSESEESLKIRLSMAKREMQMAKEYDHVVVNDDLDQAFAELKKIIGGYISWQN